MGNAPDARGGAEEGTGSRSTFLELVAAVVDMSQPLYPSIVGDGQPEPLCHGADKAIVRGELFAKSTGSTLDATGSLIVLRSFLDSSVWPWPTSAAL
jgi:hypothetical protein